MRAVTHVLSVVMIALGVVESAVKHDHAFAAECYALSVVMTLSARDMEEQRRA